MDGEKTLSRGLAGPAGFDVEMTPHNPNELPTGLPVPIDDGAANHLVGALLPDLVLASTNGQAIRLSKLPQPAVLFFYPRTGVPGQPPSHGFAGKDWDDIPGARG